MKKTFSFHGQVGYQKSRGVTLIEALITIGVMAILVVAGVLFINQNARAWNRQAISTSLEDQLRSVEDRITLDLRKSNYVSTADGGSRLLFRWPETPTAFTNYYQYNSLEKILYRKPYNGTLDPITSNNIASASFTLVGSPTANAVLISIAGSESQGTETISKTISFTVRLRNMVGASSSSPMTSPSQPRNDYALSKYLNTSVGIASANDGSLLVLEDSNYGSGAYKNNKAQRLWP